MKNETALLAPESNAEAELVELINQKVKPNKPLEGKEVFIRKMFLVSDQINSFGGRFDRKELLKMAELVIDAPVLVGHNHQKLPIGRSFSAEIVERNGAAWLAAHFYWLAEAAGAENLAKNIDGGIYKEVSAAFLFETPECSVCGGNIRSCEHVPFRRYAVPNGSLKPAFFWYRNVSKFLEASLVFRGAVAGTGIAAPMGAQKGEVFTTKVVERRTVQSRRRRLPRIYR
ncbi:MAG TPA: hypothetical protein VNL73_09460 [Verrucomicrobiae bacterium]|nr:hypothetical protein [Verrucomicrobiae bacterium]